MTFGDLARPRAGVALPLFSLRTDRSVGIGQYPDIVPLARWCRSVGLEVIQLLPLNDTGDTSSPYSALSAFALNPVYLDVEAVPGSEIVRAEMHRYREEAEARPRVVYAEVRARKLSWLRSIYDGLSPSPASGAEVAAFVRDNPWVPPYARFVSLKAAHGGSPWWAWPAGATAPDADVAFHEWLQYVACRQLGDAARKAGELGVRIMGDLPILMSRDSSEVWSTPRYFDADYQAGAPPDMFSPDGQNWGFPPYRWDEMKKDDYRLWRDRLRYAGTFYHAIRIDHVLGFLRIWRIPATESTGILGHFHPRRHLSRRELDSFDDGRIAWLTRPHTTGAQIEAALGPEAPRVRERYFARLGSEDLFLLAPSASGERAIESQEPPGRARDFLLARHRDRSLLDLGHGWYSPAWYHARTGPYGSLFPEERRALDDLVQAAYVESEKMWEREGRRLLDMIRTSTDMLVCAEDLGAVPDCLPPLLEDLGILGLRIERWAREYKKPGQPLVPPDRYPRLSVCSPSVHDTTTLRGWWEEPGWDRAAYYRALGYPGTAPEALSPELCRAILGRAMRSASALAVVTIQDYLALGPSAARVLPADERVNVPGTVGNHNWSYRIPMTVEELDREGGLAATIRALVAERGG